MNTKQTLNYPCYCMSVCTTHYLVEHDHDPASPLVTGPQVLSSAGNRKVESSQEADINTRMKVPIWV